MKTVCLYQAKTHFEALTIKETLESNGIICLMPNEHISGVVPYYSQATGGFMLLVSETSYDNALEILEQVIRIYEDSESEEDDIIRGIESCPQCKSKEIEFTKTPRRGLIISLLVLLMIPVPAFRYRYVCLDCGNTWRRYQE